MASLKRSHGQPCPYCGRVMQLHHPRLAPTRDHVHPESKGGRAILVACLQCNGIKADMLPDQWAAFMARVPGWWKLDKMAMRAVRRTLPEFATAGQAFRLPFPRRPPSRRPKPVIVPPELVYANTLRPYDRAMFLLQAERDAKAQATGPGADVSKCADSGEMPDAGALAGAGAGPASGAEMVASCAPDAS